ncbi:helix-turn-helix transcriptional regulator [Xenorhabdus bovienii]|uniref:helix-turn-helix transcriptional regulator n=1 Tax=Xenorhabdus bovienii TaxID=40576 RepID=UPI0023B2ED37|nr:AlpA family transcriptional regulator [Xenorhabdus bovienii]MDE9427493.1 AlpA family transcriptional regulator [Xenorhabdus bovienii]
METVRSLIDMKYMTDDSGFTEQYFYKMIKEKKFPAPIKFGRASRWKFDEYIQWIESRKNESRKLS